MGCEQSTTRPQTYQATEKLGSSDFTPQPEGTSCTAPKMEPVYPAPQMEPIYCELNEEVVNKPVQHVYMKMRHASEEHPKPPISDGVLGRATTVCSICSKPFKHAKLLPCFHFFCLDCVELLSADGHLSCPTCGVEHELPTEGAVSLPDCSFLDVLMDRVFQEGASTATAPADTSQTTSDVLCCVCTKAKSCRFCVDCGIVMCAQCGKTHRNIPATKNHKLMSMEEYQQSALLQAEVYRPNVCSKHKGREFASYCITCEVPICDLCILYQHRKPDHKQKTLKDVMAKKQGQLLRKLEEARKRACALEGLSSEITRKEKASEEWYRKREDTIKGGFQELMDGLANAMKYLEAEREEMLGDVHRNRNSDRAHLQSLGRSTLESLSEVKACMGTGAELLQHSNEVGFLSLVGQTVANLDKNMEKEPAQLPSLTPRAALSPEERLSAITDEAVSIFLTGNDPSKYVDLKKTTKGTFKAIKGSVNKVK